MYEVPESLLFRGEFSHLDSDQEFLFFIFLHMIIISKVAFIQMIDFLYL